MHHMQYNTIYISDICHDQNRKEPREYWSFQGRVGLVRERLAEKMTEQVAERSEGMNQADVQKREHSSQREE